MSSGTSCGAALSDESQPGCIGTVIEGIAPSADAVRGSEDPYRDAVFENVRRTAERPSRTGPIVAAGSGEVLVAGAVHDLASGRVGTI